MKQTLIIDSGFFLAIMSEKDQNHHKALNLRNKIDRLTWMTTWPVITEVCHLLIKRQLIKSVIGLFEMHERGGYEIFNLTTNHTPLLKKLMQHYRELPMDLADASLVILADELGNGNIVSTDMRDFNTYRWKNHHPFHNLFLY